MFVHVGSVRVRAAVRPISFTSVKLPRGRFHCVVFLGVRALCCRWMHHRCHLGGVMPPSGVMS